MSDFILPALMPGEVTLYDQGGSTTVTQLSDLTQLKDCDYAAIQAVGSDITYRTDDTDPTSSVGFAVLQNAWSRDILSAQSIQKTRVYGKFNVLAYKCPPKK